MKNELITVIVPVYKVERYLKQCVDSVTGQTYRELEIILVDDGSPDRCGAMCDEYARADSRVRVIHKANGGLSDARNAAIGQARGTWLTFIDSDDYLHPRYMAALHEAAIEGKCDIAVCNFFFENEADGSVRPAYAPSGSAVFSRDEALAALLYQRDMETSAWGKLYRTSLWRDICFPKGQLFEDIATVYKTYLAASRVALIAEPLYYYRLRGDSIMGQGFYPKKMEAVHSARMMMDDIAVRVTDRKLVQAARCRYVSMCFNILFQTPRRSAEENFILNEIRKFRPGVLRDKKARKKTRIALSLSYLGTGILRRIYSVIH